MRKFWHLNLDHRRRTLFALVVVAGIGLLIAIIALLNSSLGVIADKTNELDAKRSAEAVQAAMDSTTSKMVALVSDNSAWDDAVAHSYRPVADTAWLYSTWGAVSDDAHAYDGTFILDEHQGIIWGYFRGKPYTGVDPAVLGSGFEALFNKNAIGLSVGHDPVAGLTETAFGEAFVGVGLIHPVSGLGLARGTSKRYLVMTRHLTPAMLSDLGKTFRVDDLRFAATAPDATTTKGPQFTLMNTDGQSNSALTWTLRMPGVEAAKVARPKIENSLVLIGLLILLFVAVAAYCLRRVARHEAQARQTALTDGLSGLPNRRALLERLQTLDGGRGDDEDRGIVFIDLDGFKDINDLYGHETGDQLIVIVSEALKVRRPKGALLARMGGDEFALVVHGARTYEKACDFSVAAHALLDKPIQIGDRTIQVGASIGIACTSSQACSSHELLRRADMAMYDSKQKGKGQVTHYDGALDAARLKKQALEIGMREGLACGEFDVLYQPIIDSSTQTVGAVEALVRWPRRPEGPLGPDAFIPIAETSGLIHTLGLFVLTKACGELRDVPTLKLSVNVSPAQFRDPDFENKVAAVLQETGFPASRLELEVTEGYLIENPERAITVIAALKAMGIAISLDDFGTGYSSIGYLRRYGFDKIKIDKSLASLVDLDPQAAALVAGTVSIANALHMSVTAEGVETEDHARLLRLAGCHTLQGYLYSKPKPLSEVLTLQGSLALKALRKSSMERLFGTSPQKKAATGR